ncbi:MAG: L-rhamnose mutarotase [Pseudoruegeria sp.]
MEKIAFRMELKPNCVDLYRQRHDEIWPELTDLLTKAGIRDYSIFHDPETNALFAVLYRSPSHTMAKLPAHDVMQRWWDYMADLMETDANNRPVETSLIPVFHHR